MKSGNKLIGFICITFMIVVFCESCLKKSVPNNFKKIVSELSNELNRLEEIPKEEKILLSNENTHQSMVTLKKRQQFFNERRHFWDKLFEELNVVKGQIRETQYFDDIVFCIAVGYLKIVFLCDSEMCNDKTLQAIAHFIELDENAEIEPWTQKKLGEIIWNKLEINFSKNISEKSNLNQFFYIAEASLWSKKKQYKKALESYSKAIDINSEGLWGKQAQIQIDLLRDRGSTGDRG